MIDSIDQLIESDYNDLHWIMYNFSLNIKFIFSTLESQGSILEQIKIKIQNSDNFLRIDPLSISNVKVILDNRLLSEPQWKILNSMFAKSKLHPLLVKLVFDIVSKWRSFFEPDKEYKNIRTIDDCIKYLFKLLEILRQTVKSCFEKGLLNETQTNKYFVSSKFYKFSVAIS